MAWKRITASVLAAALILAAPGTLISGSPSAISQGTAFAAVQSDADYYFYDQLPSESKVFYDAIYEMYAQGILKTGNGDLDLTAAGILTQAQTEAYADNGAAALALFGAARDAFRMEHTDTFYVDYDSLSIRATSGADGCHLYIGTGRRDSYYATGFTDASQVNDVLSAYEDAVTQIAAEAESAAAQSDEDPVVAKVRYVHDYLTHHTSYRLENACKAENLGYIRNACGPLLGGEAVCEGYSRAFKAVLDRLGIPCLLVNGAYRHTEEIVELHMWNDVRINGVWYGTDVTMDDPVTKVGDSGVDGCENDELFLAGESVMYKKHVEDGVISEANFAFSYPALALDRFGVVTTSFSNGLTVRYNQNGMFEDIPAGEFYISYQGMGYAKAAEQGKYMLSNMSNYYEATDEWISSGWCYITPELYPALEDSDTELYMPMPHVQYVQFGVTDIPYGYTDYEGYEIPDLYYHGDPFLLEASTEILHNPNGNYVAPPYMETISPILTSKLVAGKTYHVNAVYNDTLIRSEEDLDVTFTSTGRTAAQYAVIENVAWDGDRTVTFDFTPSKMWADDNVIYTISISGLVGRKSLKAPIEIEYIAASEPSFCCARTSGYNWNVFGQPSLLDNSDISTSDWKTADGEPVDEQLKHRMVLIASRPTNAQTDTMNDLLDAETDGKVLRSETYNINLTVCRQMVIQTGQGVRVSLGFPDGYGPDDEGVTFKAYHFMKNSAGEITGVEEIPCMITQYGLIVLCKSFSPFAVVAVEDDGAQTSAEKSLVAVSTQGGTVSGAEGIVTLAEGNAVTLKIQADDGYVIEAVTVGGAYAELTDSKAMTLTVGYDDLAENAGIVDVKFAAESVIEAEATRGETAIQIDAHTADAEPEAKAGDLNADGVVSVADAVLLAKYIAEIPDPAVSHAALALSDFDGDGLLTILDVAILLKRVG